MLPRDLPRSRHADRFVVGSATAGSARAELAPLSPSVAEVRSLVVDRALRRSGVATGSGGVARSRTAFRLRDARVHA